MKQAYWDKIADNYDEELFDVLSNDRKQLIAQRIRKYGKGKRLAADLGCGSGRFLPILSKTFDKVLAVDLSPKCLKRAKQENQYLENVTYQAADLAGRSLDLRKIDLALSVASIMTPDLALRNRLFDNITRQLKTAAHFILVVPALESAMFVDSRLIEWNLKQGTKSRDASRERFSEHRKRDVRRLREGMVAVDGVLTKHYLREEMIALLETRDMTILDVQKIEYGWDTEFARPPRWMQGPYPWDWLLVARKKN